jgi:tRNA A-37 threonylcarbamoyl transferase component Bud32
MSRQDREPLLIRAALAATEAQALARALTSAAWCDGARVLKKEAGAEVLAGDSAAGGVVVKSLRDSPGPANAIARLMRRSRLEREWSRSERLARAGIDVAPMLALWRWRDERGGWVESLAMRRVEGPTLLEAIANPPSELSARSALARAAGELVARVLAAGLFNRDQKPSNIIVARRDDGAGAGAPVLVVIDPVGVRSRGPMRASVARRRMLFSLIVEPIGCGIDVPMRPRMEAMHACVSRLTGTGPGDVRRVVREDFRAIDQMLFEHGDPTPRTDPRTR